MMNRRQIYEASDMTQTARDVQAYHSQIPKVSPLFPFFTYDFVQAIAHSSLMSVSLHSQSVGRCMSV